MTERTYGINLLMPNGSVLVYLGLSKAEVGEMIERADVDVLAYSLGREPGAFVPLDGGTINVGGPPDVVRRITVEWNRTIAAK